MTPFDKPTEIEDVQIQETTLDLPNVPVGMEGAKVELIKTSFVSDVCKSLNLKGNVDSRVYRGLTIDKEGNLLFNHKRITKKSGNQLKLLSVNTLRKNPDSREFLRLIGLDTLAETKTRDEETVAPEQTAAMKAKADSFKVTEDWAKKEKEKASRQLAQTTDEAEKLKLQESVQYFDQIEIQANRRYSEVVQNQFKRINTIINDETRTIGERLKELFRRDGLTIGALITAIGMTISTIVLAILPSSSPTPNNNDKSYIDRVKDAVKNSLVKVANFLLGLAKKALTALPGILGSVVSFILRKAGEVVLFLSEHLIILFLALLLAVFEFVITKIRKTPTKQEG